MKFRLGTPPWKMKLRIYPKFMRNLNVLQGVSDVTLVTQHTQIREKEILHCQWQPHIRVTQFPLFSTSRRYDVACDRKCNASK